ncbi:MAG: acyl-protein synthetase [Chloroflexi bacterium]|nr:acyl-protein synthetase [Chloroflexota bacterium]
MKAGQVENMINHPGAYDFNSETNDLFLGAMQENFAHHYHGSEIYRGLCDRTGFTPDDLKTYDDIPGIPSIFVTVFKNHTILSVPQDQIELVLTSSGTGGMKSRTHLDPASLSRIRRIVFNIYGAFGMVDEKHETDYICFTYDPDVAGDIGTAFSDKLLASLTAQGNVFWAIKYDEKAGDFRLDIEGCLDALEKYSHNKRPFRILGFPSFAYELMKEYKKRKNKNFNFGDRSYMITGGGWKTLGDKEIPKPVFRKEVGEWLGMPPENIRDLYGLVEHGVPYCECERGNFHVPIYSRAYVRHPGTLQLLPEGETGLLQLVTPYLNSFPALSLLTSDLGRVYKNCPCGRSAPVLELAGRGGVRKLKGCAIAALDFLAMKRN